MDSKIYAELSNALMTEVDKQFVSNTEFKHKVMGVVFNKIRENRMYFAGRTVSGSPVTYTAIRIGKLGGVGAGVVGVGNLGFAGYGRMLNLIDSGVSDAVQLMSRSIYGKLL